MTGGKHSAAIACGGTGGHLFPGVAVAEALKQRDFDVTLIVSQKEIDQRAVKTLTGTRIIALPAVGLQKGSRFSFLRGLASSYRLSSAVFSELRPQAALAMGGFTSAAPILAAKRLKAETFLHESNTIPGRANRWLARIVDRAFVGFPSTAARLANKQVTVTGTPVRPAFVSRDAAACRRELGLAPDRPVILVIGGSQGASGINDLMVGALPIFSKIAPQWQWLHLAGERDAAKVRDAYTAAGITAVVHSFFDRMEFALAAASAAVSRAGASSLSEFAAMKIPAVLVPYPSATDDHQLHNARALVQTGAARLLEQSEGTPELLARLLEDLVTNTTSRELVQNALSKWQAPHAADHIADLITQAVLSRASQAGSRSRAASAAFNEFPGTRQPQPAGALAEEVEYDERCGRSS